MKKLLLLLLCTPLFAAPVKTYTTKPVRGPLHAKGLKWKALDKSVVRHSMKGLRATIPTVLDYRPKISPVLNQGGCGSCYAFGGAAGPMTDEFMVAGIKTPVLSQIGRASCRERG